MSAVIEELVGDVRAAQALLNSVMSRLAASINEERRLGAKFEDRAVALSEAMEMLKQSRATIWREIRRGRLKKMPGGRVRFSLAELQRYMAASSNN